MKFLFTLIFLLCGNILNAQVLQQKSFYVNACTFFGSFKTELQPICEGFDVIVSTSELNIGDEFNLRVNSVKYNYPNDGQVTLSVNDPRNRIDSVILGKMSNGSDYIILKYPKYKTEEDSGVIFQFWDYVSAYDFWRVERKNPRANN